MTDGVVREKGKVRLIFAATIGNAFEFYDFTLYSFFVITIGKLFFPSSDPWMQIVLALATYGVGFLARPLGGLILGSYGDRAGRKSAMTLTLFLMAAGTLMIGLAPSYAQIGWVGPVILVLGRMLQGFSAGGEVGASTSLLAEYATSERRGYFGSWQIASQGLGIVFASLSAITVYSLLPESSVEAWGWRVPFLIGALILPIGIMLRRKLEETYVSSKDSPTTAMETITHVFRGHWRSLLTGFLVIAGGTAANTIVAFYLSTHAIRVLKMPPAVALLAGLAAGLVAFLTGPLFGTLSDRTGRKPLMFAGMSLMILAIYPAFLIINAYPTLPVLLGVVIIINIFNVMANATGITALAEHFPTPVRSTCLSLVYAAGVTVFGGFGQFIAAWLTGVTGTATAPALYVIAMGLISLIGIRSLHERAGKALT